MDVKIRQLFLRLLYPILGRKALQNIFENLYLFSLAGMNYGFVIPGNSGEKNVLEYINSKKRGNITIFDVGANKGYYTENILEIFGKRARIFDFEPLKDAAKILKKRFAKKRQIEIFNIGFSDRAGKATIHFDDSSSELASLYDRRIGAISLPAPLSKKQTVSLSTIDSFCQKNRIEHIDLLKIDTEGHELKVLTGAKNMIKKNKIDFIQFEFGGVMIDSRTFFVDIFTLLNSEYRIYRILQDGLREIKNCNEKHEIFLIGNYLAINRNLAQVK